jgi:hypothetical protein
VLLLWQKGSSADNLSLLYAFVGLLPVIYLVMNYDQFSSLSRINKGINLLKNEEDFAKYIYSMALLTERCLEPNPMTQLRLGLKKLLFDSNSNHWISSMTLDLKAHLNNDLPAQEFRTQTYALLVVLAEKYRAKFSSATYVSLLLAHILYTKLSLRWKAIYEIEYVNHASSTARIKIASYRFLHLFHDELNEFEVKQKSEGIVDLSKLMNILKGFSLLNEKITVAYSLYFDFWMLLGSEKPDVKIAQKIGINLNSANFEIRRAYDRLLEQNPNQAKTILLYANYLRYVVNDREEADRIASKASNLISNSRNNGSRNVGKEDSLHYSDASSLCIIIVSGESGSLGLIRSMNTETLRRLDLTSEDIKGKYINSFMPKIYGDHHNK